MSLAEFDALIAGIGGQKKGKKKAAFKPQQQFRSQPQSREQSLPDALVLVIFTVRCDCGNTYTSPNDVILKRNENSITRLSNWSNGMNHIKREVIKREKLVDACELCFSNKSLDLHGRFAKK